MAYDAVTMSTPVYPTATISTYAGRGETPRPAVNLELVGALSDLREITAEATKACEEYLVARDRWFALRANLDDQNARVNALRDQHDRTT